ncbi:MAG: sulfatase-like hydrolase/transferase [Planctomycetota bacterium]
MLRTILPSLCAACFAVLSAGQTAVADDREQPNILWIVTDDHRYDSIAAFNKILTGKEEGALGPVSSPNVDELVAEGTTFINAFTQSPACAPSRAAMHSGRYPHRRGVYGFELHHANNEAIYRKTIPEVLADAGYETARTGKLGERTIQWNGASFNWSNELYGQNLGGGRESTLLGFTDWVKEPIWQREPRGHVIHFHFDDEEHVSFFHPNTNVFEPDELAKADEIFERLDILTHNPAGLESPQGKMIISGVSSRSPGFTRDGYHVKNLTDHLENVGRVYPSYWGEELQGPDPAKPQMFHLGFDFPHTPVLPPASFREQFQKYTYRIPTASEEELESMPAQIRQAQKARHIDYMTDDEKQRMIQDYYAFCAYGDWLVGEAVDQFKAYSEAQGQPWMIVYVCGDHGWKLGEHGATSKFMMYGLDLQTPIVVVSSDKETFPAGKVVHDLAELIDIAPTLYSAAGIDVNAAEFEHLDGLDLAKIASGEASRDYVLAEAWWVTGPRGSIRTRDFAFSMKVNPTRAAGDEMDWPLDKPLAQVDPQLFDLRSDPAETVNLALDPDYAAVAEAMRNKLEDILIRDGRIEVEWDNGLEGKVFRLDGIEPKFGGDDKRLRLPVLEAASTAE